MGFRYHIRNTWVPIFVWVAAILFGILFFDHSNLNAYTNPYWVAREHVRQNVRTLAIDQEAFLKHGDDLIASFTVYGRDGLHFTTVVVRHDPEFQSRLERIANSFTWLGMRRVGKKRWNVDTVVTSHSLDDEDDVAARLNTWLSWFDNATPEERERWRDQAMRAENTFIETVSREHEKQMAYHRQVFRLEAPPEPHSSGNPLFQFSDDTNTTP